MPAWYDGVNCIAQPSMTRVYHQGSELGMIEIKQSRIKRIKPIDVTFIRIHNTDMPLERLSHKQQIEGGIDSKITPYHWHSVCGFD